jgi:hypothetical protein
MNQAPADRNRGGGATHLMQLTGRNCQILHTFTMQFIIHSIGMSDHVYHH